MTTLRIARALLVMCSLAAASAAVGAWSVVAAAPQSTAMAEAWRMVGYATFAALFATLAAHPARNVGLWAIVVANKFVLTVSAVTWLAAADGASQAIAWDGALTVLLLVAAVLARPWRRSVPALGAGLPAKRTAREAILE